MAPRSTYNEAKLVDLADVDRLREMFSWLPVVFADAVEKVSPEFGAYMSYSLFLEAGTRKMPARPHLVPAVYATAQEVMDGVGLALLDVTQRVFAQGRSVSGKMAETLYANAWIAMLNGPTRKYAVDMCTALEAVEYGFHRRSIAGYAYARSAEEIRAAQYTAQVQRDALKLVEDQKKQAKLVRDRTRSKVRKWVTLKKQRERALKKKQAKLAKQKASAQKKRERQKAAAQKKRMSRKTKTKKKRKT